MFSWELQAFMLAQVAQLQGAGLGLKLKLREFFPAGFLPPKKPMTEEEQIAMWKRML